MSDSELKEAFHIRGTHWLPRPESDACPITHPVKDTSPDGVKKCYTATAAAALRQSRVTESEALKEIVTKTTRNNYFVIEGDSAKDLGGVTPRGLAPLSGPIAWALIVEDQEANTNKARVLSGVSSEADAEKEALAIQEKEMDPKKIVIIGRSAGKLNGSTIYRDVSGFTYRIQEAHEGIPVISKRGMSVAGTFDAIQQQGRKFTQPESGFVMRGTDPNVACGACRFYLRDPSTEVGQCQIVEGPIPWFSTCDFYIGAAEDARASFPAMSEPAIQQFGESEPKELFHEAYKGGKGPKFKVLKENKVALTESEREEVMNAKAVWHHGPNGEESAAVWKSVVAGKIWFVTNTHRAYNVTESLKGTIKQFHDFIKGTA